LPNKLGGGAAAAYEEYSFDGNKSELSSLQRSGNIYDSPFLERRNNKEPDKPIPTKVLLKDPPAQVFGHEPELDTMSGEMSPVWNKYVNKYSAGFFFIYLVHCRGASLSFM
jgi:hypothetical protein